MIDVTGFTLGEALQLLKSEGIARIEVKLTTTPRKAGEEYNLQSRVVRQKLVKGIATKEFAADTTVPELVVCNLEQQDG